MINNTAATLGAPPPSKLTRTMSSTGTFGGGCLPSRTVGIVDMSYVRTYIASLPSYPVFAYESLL